VLGVWVGDIDIRTLMHNARRLGRVFILGEFDTLAMGTVEGQFSSSICEMPGKLPWRFALQVCTS
jgi:hypothetical protein